MGTSMTRNADRDSELALELRRGNANAMAELYDRYGRLVFLLILRIVHDAGTAGDLVQETLLRVWTSVPYFDANKGSLPQWLLAIGRNRAIDYVRSARLRTQNTVAFEESEHGAQATEPARFEETSLVRGAMQKLLPNHMRVIELAYFEGLSQCEVAERLGQPLGTVKSWV